MKQNVKTVQELAQDKERKIMETVAWRAGYYRANPQRMVNDVLFDEHDFKLKWFQSIILWMMMHYNYIIYLAARGQGKTLLIALFCVVRCILFPGTKIVVTSGTLKQANEVLLKIQDEFMPKSIFLRSEISKCNIGQNDAVIMFKNTSWIKTRTSNQNSRSARANCLIADEFRMIDETVMNTVLRKFLSSPRQPGYLNKEEYKHLQERNFEAYLSSAFFKSSWGYRKAQDYTLNFFDDKRKYMIVGLPYQISIKEGLLMREQVEDEMTENSYNELEQAMEMECLWIGDDGDNLFRFDEIDKRRKIKNAFLPLKFYNDKIKVPPLTSTEKRVLSVDVALMGSSKKKKNDASALYINSAIQQDDTSYQSNIIYGETFEGLTTDELGIITMRFFYKYKCTHLVLDTNGRLMPHLLVIIE